MAKFNIIDAVTGNVKYTGAPRYNGVYCKVSCLEFIEIASPTKIDWKVGDYVVYNGSGRTGLTYRLYDIPQPKRQAKNSQYGGAFVYSNVQFFAETKRLDIEPFRDVVLADNFVHFSTRESWSVWASVADLVERMQAVMDAARPNEWEFRLVDATSDSDLYNLLHNNYQDFTISGESVLSGLEKIYSQWGEIGWLHTVENGKNVITIGIPPIRTSGIGTDASGNYIYGKGNGLLSLKKTSSNKDNLRTRLYVYGSTRNMIPRYYNNLIPAIKDNESVDVRHLMIPLSYWGSTDGKKDTSKAYIENNTALYGVRPDSVYFDGSELPEIYPSLEETNIGQLYDAMASGSQYRPNLSKWNRGDRLDEIVSASGIDDDGTLSTSGEKYQYSDNITIPESEEEWPTGAITMSQTIYDSGMISHSGKMDIELSNFVPIISDTSNAIVSISLRMRIVVGGRAYESPISWSKQGTNYRGSVATLRATCNYGETFSLQIVGEIDSVSNGEQIVLSVPATTVTGRYAITRTSEFTVRIPQIGFNIAERAALGSQGIATIAMKDGMCGGRSFVVKSCKYDSASDSWNLTVWRGKDDSLDTLFPNTTFPIVAGDHFVLLDIIMPETYIGMAEQKLYAEGQKLLSDVSRIRPFYEPEIDAKFMVDNSRTLREGWYMALQDADIIGQGTTEYVLIDTLTINENDSAIPTYRVTLREQKRTSYSNTGTSAGYTLTSLAGGNSSSAQVTASGVSSVGLSMPTGFSVAGSPIKNAGEFQVSFAEGYNLLTDAQKAVLDLLGYDAENNAVYVKKQTIGGVLTPTNFYTFGESAAGGAGSGGGEGASYLYELQDVPDYRTAYRGKYLRAKSDGSGVEWGDVTGGASAFDDLTGRPKYNGVAMTSSTDIPAVPTALSQLTDDTSHRLVTDTEKTTWDGKQDTISDLTTIRSQAANGQTAYGWGNHASAGYLTGITSSMVTTALGYTPYNAANIGSASVAYASNAGQLGGLGSGSYAAMTNQNGLNYETNLKGGLYVSYNTSGALSGDKGVINIPTWANNSATTYYLTQISFGVNDNTPKIRYVNNTGASNFVTVYHSGNTNNTSTPWSCSDLTASGTATIGSHMYMTYDRYVYWQDNTNGTNRTVISVDATTNFAWGMAAGGKITNLCGNGISFRYDTAHSEGMILTSSGNVGIGTPSPSEKLHVAGNILATGNMLRSTTGQSIGTSAAPWGEIHANKWYPNANDTTNYIEYTGSGFLIHGNVAATGEVTAGQAN